MTTNELDDLSQQFLITLFEQTNGDASVQVSMYDVGDLLGMDRDSASAVAQELMGRQLAEIRTLSGGIGISADGAAVVRDITGPMATGSSESASLGDGPLLTSGGQQAVDQIVTELKGQTGSLGLDYDALGEMMADIKTVEAQLDSPRPKTEIIRECLRSILEVIQRTQDRQIVDRIHRLAEK